MAENTPKDYLASLVNLKKVYPDIIVVPVGTLLPDTHGGWVTDKLRIETLAISWLDEDVLYLDLDVVAHKPLITTSQKPLFPNMCCGILEYWAIYRPRGCEGFFQKLLNSVDFKKWGLIKRIINTELRNEVDIMYGYPSWEFVDHLQLSRKRGKYGR
jgi:hypothetical protein